MIWHSENYIDTCVNDVPSICQVCGTFQSNDTELEEDMVSHQTHEPVEEQMTISDNMGGSLNTDIRTQ